MMTAVMTPLIAVVCYDDCSDDAIDCCCGVISHDIGSAFTGFSDFMTESLQSVLHDGTTAVCVS